MSVVEGSSAIVSQDNLPVTNVAGATLNITDAKDFRVARLYVKNTGAAALTAAKVQGSMDGTNYEDLDAANVTTKFGTLAAGSAATLFIAETNLRFTHLRLLLTTGTTTTVTVKLLVALL